jgi:hypothetical protein
MQVIFTEPLLWFSQPLPESGDLAGKKVKLIYSKKKKKNATTPGTRPHKL